MATVLYPACPCQPQMLFQGDSLGLAWEDTE